MAQVLPLSIREKFVAIANFLKLFLEIDEKVLWITVIVGVDQLLYFFPLVVREHCFHLVVILHCEFDLEDCISLKIC